MSLQAAFLMLSPRTRTCSTIMLYISSATNDPWPHPLRFSFLLLFLFVSYDQDSFPKHIITLAPVQIILRFWDQFTTECSHVDKLCAVCVHFLILDSYMVVFWMRTWLNLCKMMLYCVEFCRKALSKLCKNGWNVVKSLRNVFLFRELYEWFENWG